MSAGLGRPRSLRTRLLLWLVSLHLIALVATAWFSYGAFDRLVHHFMDEQMQALANSYLLHPAPRAPLPQTADLATVRQGAFVVQLWSADGRTLLNSSWPEAGVPLQPRPGFADVRFGDGEDGLWRVYTAEPSVREGRPRVQVLQSEGFRRQRVMRRALFEGLPIALLLPVVLLILWVIVSAVSRSLRTFAHEVAMRDAHSLQELSLVRVPDEIVPLVRAFNTLLARLRVAFATQQRFVQDAAHELRTPMAAIHLQIENLRSHVPAGEATERFAQLEAGVSRAQHSIEQLLRLSRQDDADPVGARVPVNVADLLRDTVGELMVLADQRRVDIGFEGRMQLVVQASPAELRSLFGNLVDNALRCAPEGGVVDVRLHPVDGHAVVDVIDNGPGIPSELLARVFDRFFRVPGSAAGGSGLGLAIAQAAALRHGFRIELRNRKDEAGASEEGATGLIARVHLG